MPRAVLRLNFKPAQCHFIPDDNAFLILDSLGRSFRIAVNDLKKERLASFNRRVSTIAYDPAEKMILIGSLDSIVIYRLSGEKRLAAKVGFKTKRIIIDKSRRQLIVIDSANAIHVLNYSLKETTKLGIPSPQNSIITVRFFDPENFLFIGYENHTVLLYDLTQNQVIWTFKGYKYAGFNNKINSVLVGAFDNLFSSKGSAESINSVNLVKSELAPDSTATVYTYFVTVNSAVTIPVEKGDIINTFANEAGTIYARGYIDYSVPTTGAQHRLNLKHIDDKVRWGALLLKFNKGDYMFASYNEHAFTAPKDGTCKIFINDKSNAASGSFGFRVLVTRKNR